MLGIWHGGDWLKRDLAQPIYGWVEHGSPISGWILRPLISDHFHGILCVNLLVYMCIIWIMYL